MTDPAMGAACAATAALCVPVLVQIGIDPASGIGGAVGVVIVQTLIERDASAGAQSYLKLAAVTLGSVALASMLAPVVAPWAISTLAGADPRYVRGLTAAAIGGFAQPIVMWIKRAGLPAILGRFLPPGGGPKEGREP